MRLLDLAPRQRWSAIVARSSTHPHEISAFDEDGFTALHWVCFNQPPLRAVRALLRHDVGGMHGASTPAALLQDFGGGLTPLHCSCSCGASPEVVEELVRCCPNAVTVRDSEGWTPLHYICHSAYASSISLGEDYPFAVASLLIDANQSVAKIPDREGHTPLVLLCHSFDTTLVKTLREISKHKFHKSPGVEGGRASCREFRVFWSLASLLVLKCSHRYGNGVVSSRGWRLLHIMASLDQCPMAVIRIAAALHPTQTNEKDVDGSVPLHIAARNTVPVGTIDAIVESDPSAAQVRNDRSDLPLALAIESGKTWSGGIKSILEAFPSALASTCIEHGYYPFVLEKIARDTSSTTMFVLLRSMPDLVMEM